MTWNPFKKSLRPAKPFRPCRFRPGLETLEDRTLLAASPLVFTLDTVASALTVSGQANVPGQVRQVMAQGPGSLTTTISGTIATQYDPAASTLQFVQAGTLLDANVNGVWQPAEGGLSADPPAPADVGAMVDVRFNIGFGIFITIPSVLAIRDLTASLSTPAGLPLSGGPGSFTFPSTQTIALTGGNLDATPESAIGGVTGGRVSLAGESGANMSPTAGTFQDLGNGAYRVTVPIDFTISDQIDAGGGQFIPFTLRVAGSLQGNAIIPIVDLNGSAGGADFAASGPGNNTPIVLADAAATVTRTPTADLTSAIITLTNRPDGAAESLSVDVGTSGLTQSYNPTTGILTISGTAAPSVYEGVLRTATYRNSLATPTAVNRVIQFAVRDADDSSLIRTTTVTIVAPATFQVAAPLTLTPTGFIASFNRAFDPSVLNLYDANGVLGDADVTVVGTNTGAVRGSLFFGPGNTSMTFIATGGVLAPDTYTVIFRSATDGFKDGTGAQLDGNGDGTAGDPFTTTLNVVSSSDRILSIPDFARGPGQDVDLPANADNDLVLTIDDGAGITTLSLELRYNPSLLTINGFVPAAGVSLDTSTLGVAQLTINAPLASGPVQLVRLLATVPNDAGYGSKQLLDLTSISLNGGDIAARDDDGIHVAAYFGDATGNGQVTSADAQRALRVALGLDSGFAAFQLADPSITTDSNGDGRTSSTDATVILREAIGIDQASIPLRPSLPSLTAGGPDPFLNIPKRFVGQRGNTLTVPVNLDRPEGLNSLMLAISFDPTRLEALTVARGNLTAGFTLSANIDNTAGTIVIGGFAIDGLADEGPGSVALITFRIRDDAPLGRAIINLRQDLNGAFTALNEDGLDLMPDPTNRAGDILDGLITVLPRPRTLLEEVRERVEAILDRLPAVIPVPPSTVIRQRVEQFFQRASSPAKPSLTDAADVLSDLLARRKGK